jgi:uncharacterized protein (DUF697 family)
MIKYIYKKMIMAENKGNNEKADTIIRNHMVWAMGAGLIPVPIADFFAVSAVQLDMIRQIAKLHDIDFSETAGKASITALTGSGLARLGARAVKFIPGVGSIIGGITMAVLSGASTYALGEVFKKHFETGGTFLDFDPGRLKKFYDEKFEKGKEIAKEIRKEQEAEAGKETTVVTETFTVISDEFVEEVSSKKKKKSKTKNFEPPKPTPKDPLSQLQAVAKMKEEGFLTEEEFEIMKKKILNED